ncbi:MAG: type II CRISPR-associated endonuclease Cas1, partial [Nitrosomonadales bacterium]|nr:type II CRISPR-associated endonuclease Cas1 [Nitrosomonadales bacterium]
MIKRIVEISNPAYLHLRNRQMVIERDGVEAGSVPVEDLGVL